VVASLALVASSICAAVAITWGVLLVSRRRDFYVAPIARSSHTRPTATAGGIGIVLPVLAAALWTGGPLGHAILLGGGILAAVGFVDDLRDLPARVRAPLQTIAVVAALAILPLPPLELPPFVIESTWLVLPASALILLWLVNLYNFMDGIDGLAAAQCLTFCVGVLLLGAPASPVLSVTAGASAGFLLFNWPPAKIFMGDVASGFLGFLLGAVAFTLAVGGDVPFVASMVLLTGFWFDATWTLCARMLTGQRFTAPHRSHLYQKLALRHGHGRTTSGYLAMNVLWLTPLASLAEHRPQWSIAVVVVAALPFLVACVWLRAGRPEAP
jgi:Fuc2NAc and GlcNAc transferase